VEDVWITTKINLDVEWDVGVIIPYSVTDGIVQHHHLIREAVAPLNYVCKSARVVFMPLHYRSSLFNLN
jgi:hypothetical protein